MRYIATLIVLLLSGFCEAQGATRPITLTWTAPTGNNQTGYSLYFCTSTTSTPCTPVLTGSPAQTFTASATSGVLQGTIGLYYSIVLIANYPPCSGTSAIGTACGSSAAVPFLPNPIPVPPTGNPPTVTAAAVP